MTSDKRDPLDVLRAELEFLERGGYHHMARAPWRPKFIFQESPTCLNLDSTRPSRPCSDCILMQFVPEDSRSKKIPCRYIPLTETGETIESFYHAATQEELEAAVRQWLGTTIGRLEREKEESLKASKCPEVHVRARFVTDR